MSLRPKWNRDKVFTNAGALVCASLAILLYSLPIAMMDSYLKIPFKHNILVCDMYIATVAFMTWFFPMDEDVYESLKKKYEHESYHGLKGVGIFLLMLLSLLSPMILLEIFP